MTKKNAKRSPHFFPRKRLGQHFLIDRNAMEKVIRTADPDPADVILEIGPGRGEMTVPLARKSCKVIAVEIDETLAAGLAETTAPLGNVDVVQGDVLKVDLEQLCSQRGRRLKIVANLPYQISAPLLMRLMTLRHLFSSMVLMLQKEVALRIVAQPGTRNYGALSVIVQLYTKPTIEMFLPPDCFFPRPKVDSALIRFLVRESPKVEVHNEKAFRRVVRASFGHRRKMLKNALRSVFGEDTVACDVEKILENIGIEPTRRAETLSLEEFSRLTGALILYLPSSGS